MIHNQRELAIMRARVARLSEAIAGLEKNPPDPSRVHPRLVAAEKDAMRRVTGEMEAAIRAYEGLLGNTQRSIEVRSIDDLPGALIQARIARGITQRDLGELLGLKQQQIQRYEATGYSAASLDRVIDVARVLGVTLSAELRVAKAELDLPELLRKLGPIGFNRRFIETRLTTLVAPASDKQSGRLSSETIASRMLGRISRILGLSEEELSRSKAVVPDLSRVGLIGFRLPKGRSGLRTSAYLGYVHCIAEIASRCVSLPAFNESGVTSVAIRQVLDRHERAKRFRPVVEHLWSSGMMILPLDDSGAFNAASLRVPGARVIVLKHPVRSQTRWMFDLLHEVQHVCEQPDRPGAVTLDVEGAPVVSGGLEAEDRANRFAGDLLLNGKSEELAQECVVAAGHSVERLKGVLPRVARSHSVDVPSLANYLAYRLALQGINWWGAATNLQDKGPDPYLQTRDAFLMHSDLSRVHGEDRELLLLALREVPDVLL